MGPPPAWPFIWASRQGQWNSHRGPGPAASLQPAHRSQIYWTSWSGFIHGWRNKKKKGRREGEQMRKHPLLAHFLPPSSESHSLYLSICSSFLLSANSIPFQSPSERSENASSYYITYAVHQSDRVWITLSVTPKSWRYQTPGLHGIAVTTSGSLGWDREPLGGPDWVKILSM